MRDVLAGREKGVYVTVLFTPQELQTLKLVLQACLEAGGDSDLLVPLAVRIYEADERYGAKYGRGGEGDAGSDEDSGGG